MSATTIYLKDYQPASFTATTVDLSFDLFEDKALISSRMQLQRQHPGELRLYGDTLELISIHMNDLPLEESAYQLVDGDLILPECPDHLTLTVVTAIRPQDNTALSGLYRSNHLFCTQCEPHGFRRITFFLDRSDVLATYTTRITADKKHYPVLLSNGNLRAQGDAPNGRHWVEWHDPFKKPSYLFALVAGDLTCLRDQFVTMSGRTIALSIYVEPGHEKACVHAMASLKKAMRWDEQEYGREYDLDVFMIVAVSDFNMGAMENKGLNIFNSKYILARPDTATDQDYSDIEGVVGHEYFHNWTGNRITCRDWFQLSLKEGLTVFRDQEFSRDMNSREVYRILDVKLLRNTQFAEDAGSMAHPVRPESYQEINNFYTATVYNKGAEVIRMQQTLLGKEGFRRGMDLYFMRHDGQAVTINDFVAAMEDANGVDFTQFKRWYSQAGTPVVTVKSHYTKGRLTLTLSQTCPPTPECLKKEPFHIPVRVALFTATGERIPLAHDVLALQAASQEFHFDNLPEKPLVSLLRDFSAPILLQQDLSTQDYLALLRFETDGYAQWYAAEQLAREAIFTCYHTPEETWALPEALVLAYQHILLDDVRDAALRAVLLTPPGFNDLAVSCPDIDVERLEKARLFFQKTLGLALLTEISTLYHRLWQTEDHAMHAAAYSRRQLRNLCLRLMMKGDEKSALPLCTQQFEQAKTMTDQLASFALLVNSTDPHIREKAVDSFYQQWKQEDLVLDKWFSLQASCEQPDTLSRVRRLLQHPAFTLKNPNKVRALIGAFTEGNPRQFHAVDGSGYAFLTDLLLNIDAINPQIAARLATPFTRWQRLNAPRQTLIKQQLTRLSSSTLSRDLRELVTKSLAN